MDLTPAQRARLGVFVAVMGLVLIATTAALLGLQFLSPKTTLRARFTESVGGLERNAPVRYQGLRIGRVEAMQVASDAPEQIEVVLTVDPKTPLFEGTTAQLDSSGLTGLRTINLLPGDPRRPRLADGALLKTHNSLMGELTHGASAIVADVHHVTEALGHLITEDNRHRLAVMADNASRLLGHLDIFFEKHGEQLGKALFESGELMAALRDASVEAKTTLKEARHTLHMLTTDAHQTLEAINRPLMRIGPDDAKDLMQEMQKAAHNMAARLGSQEGGKVIHALNSTTERMGRLVDDVDLTVRAGRDDFTKTLSSMRQAAEDLREFSRILAQNPTALVRGRQEND